jgi:DnaJ-like protein
VVDPGGQRYESMVDKQIRLAQERGDFDNLPGKGKPLPGLDDPHDEQWWIKGYLRREGLSNEALLPPSIQLRKEVDRLPETLRGLPSEQAVWDAVAELNMRIADFLRSPSGPRVPIGPVKVDEAVQRWRAGRAGRTEPVRSSDTAVRAPDPSPQQTSWWRRLLHRR